MQRKEILTSPFMWGITVYVSYEDIKKVVADLKKIHTAVTLDKAEAVFSCVKSWEDNWEVLCTFFEYPPEIR